MEARFVMDQTASSVTTVEKNRKKSARIIIPPIKFDSSECLEQAVEAATLQMKPFALFPTLFDPEKSSDDEFVIKARKALNLQKTTVAVEEKMPELRPYYYTAVSARSSSISTLISPMPTTPVIGEDFICPNAEVASLLTANPISELKKPSEPTAAVKRRRKKLKASLEPKRPMNPYFLFQQSVRQKLINENPKLGFGEISKKVGELWMGLSSGQKQPFVQRYNRYMKEYHDKIKTNYITNYKFKK